MGTSETLDPLALKGTRGIRVLKELRFKAQKDYQGRLERRVRMDHLGFLDLQGFQVKI